MAYIEMQNGGGKTKHTETYTPAVNTAKNDMGEEHEYRYVDTSGMVVPSGTYSGGTFTSNGYKTISGLKNYESVGFTVNVSASLSKTLLWENPNGNANFAAQNIELKDYASNYTYLQFDFYRGTSYSEVDTVIYPFIATDFPISTAATTVPSECKGLFVRYGSNNFRLFWFYSTYKNLRFHSPVSVYGTNVSSNSGTLVPKAIYGLK